MAEVIDDLRDRQGDATDIEVKSAIGGHPALGETLCAFANMPEGGTIILGLDESTGFSPVGLTDVAGLEAAVAAQARTAVTPPTRCSFETFQVSGRPVLVAQVEGLPLHQRPARHGGHAYLRQSDGDYRMSEQEIAQLELLKTQAMRPTRPDRQAIPGTQVGDLDPVLLDSFLSAARTASRRYAAATDAQILAYTGVTSRTGELSLAGLYAMGVAPQAATPSLGVTAAVQLPRDADGPRTRDLVHLVGPIPDLLDDAMSWVLRNTRTAMGYDERGHGVDRAELPMRAVREVVANALVHRNLDAITDSKRVEIRLLHDRLVITSPGGLWGVSESQLGRPGAKSAVNPTLYDLCKYVRLPDSSRVIEGEGGGIREAIQALRDAGLRPPRFVDTGIQFSVIISRHTLLSEDDLAWLARVADGFDLTSEERSVLVSMRHGATWNNTQVRREFAPLDSVAARRMLQRLVDTGLVQARGKRGGTQYAIASAQASPRERSAHVEPAPERQPSLPVDQRTRPTNTRHRAAILRALDEPRSVKQLIGSTNLTEGQVRYALTQLIDAGEVTMLGAQGVRGTTYQRVDNNPGRPT
ncbi:MAG: ATP-binding protein [Micropruina sp.]|uniref:ATP-binding protein n=1 Tax=Micropruina sp. TaxID=2737536 RepID=UPI0039E6DE6B